MRRTPKRMAGGGGAAAGARRQAGRRSAEACATGTIRNTGPEESTAAGTGGELSTEASPYWQCSKQTLSVAGAWSAGKIFDLTASYAAALWIALAMAVLTPAILWVVAPRRPNPPTAGQ